jgi:hypothetical protein
VSFWICFCNLGGCMLVMATIFSGFASERITGVSDPRGGGGE